MQSLPSFSLPYLVLLLFGCTGSTGDPVDQAPDLPNWPKGVTYEIFVQSFYDTDGDSIGDFNGLIEKLHYLEELGVDAVWLMPIMPSPSYHKYDITDYRNVHPDYGTMEDFKRFVDQAHGSGIKVVIDLVINHTSDRHPWFVNSKKFDPNYRDYYVWGEKDSIATEVLKHAITGDSDNLTQWHAPDGDTTMAHYYGFFWGGMPDLNFDNPKVRSEIYEVGRFWLTEVGVDGFRLDAARHIYPDDRAEDNHAFWVEFKEEMQKTNPNVYLIGEVWAPTEESSPFTRGLSALFNFDLAFSIIESIRSETSLSAVLDGPSWKVIDSISLVSVFIKNEQAFKSDQSDFINATFLSNHDQNRVASVLGNHKGKTKLAASILLTLPGSPYLYYGEELGMLGIKPDESIREPFLWQPAARDTGRAQWMLSKYSTDNRVDPLSLQQEDVNSVYRHYHELIHLRKSTPALRLGDVQEQPTDDDSLIAYTRKYDDDEVLVIHNLSSREIAYALPGAANNIMYKTTEAVALFGNQLGLPPHASVILN